MPSHRINLRGPWDYSWRPSASNDADRDAPLTGTVTMPQDWQSLFGVVAGKAVFRRRFHCPTNLDANERVYLVATEIRGAGVVKLNEETLGRFDESDQSVTVEVTNRLNSFNHLCVEIEFDPRGESNLRAGLYGVVALEIRSE